MERTKVSTKFFSRGATIFAVMFALCGAGFVSARETHEREANGAATDPPNRAVRLATVTGTVRDANGNPLAGAIISLLRDGAERVIKEARSATDGSFTTRVSPGRYVLRAVAEGFSSATSDTIQINPAARIEYGFNLVPAGQGRTLPERRRDRDDEKYRLRAAHMNRSIFQYDEKDAEQAQVATDAQTNAGIIDENSSIDDDLLEVNKNSHRRAHGFIESYAVGSNCFASNSFGTNFALETPVNEQLDLIFAGQIGNSPLQRLEVTARTNIGSRHRIGVTFGGAQFNSSNNFAVNSLNAATTVARSVSSISNAPFGQLSVRAIDEWIVRDGVVLVLGLDYSRFTGGRHRGGVASPRIGVQFDANARTRLRAAYAPHNSNAQSVAEFEDTKIVFQEPSEQPVAFIDGRAVLERSQRFEFGIERVLDNNSSIEATAFFDMTSARGVGLFNLPLDGFAVDEEGALPQLAQAVNQQGAARGIRIVYARRLNRHLSASAGYAAGRGQSLAPQAASLLKNSPALRPNQIFRNANFQTVAAQLDADLRTGTRVRTVLRFSPRAAVFAIDPFDGRLAVYDPSLSIIIAQDLPTFGLPVRATAIIDARNLLDLQPNNDDGDTLTSLNLIRRSVRGGISVRF
ncbi:MAG: hypothetical protein NVSMB56_09590 [Pyrinomonadaceae bacterium]